MAVAHLANFLISMSAKKSGRGRVSVTLDIAIIFPFELNTDMNIELTEETAPLMQSVTMKPIDMVTWLQAHLSTMSATSVVDFAFLAAYFLDSAAFQVLQSSDDFFLMWISSTGDVGPSVTTRGEARLSMARVEMPLNAGLFELVEMSLEAFVVWLSLHAIYQS